MSLVSVSRCLMGLMPTLLLVLTACSQEQAPEELPPRPVKSFTVGAATSVETVTFPGKIRAADKVDLSFQVSGQINELKILNGQAVDKGEVLAKLDQRDFLSNLKAAEAEYNRAKAEYERMGVLVERKLVSQSEYDSKKAQQEISEANLERARKALSDTELRAPFEGVISNRYVEKFEDINAKQPIFSLQNPSYFEVVINIAENVILRLERFRDVAKVWASFDALPGRRFPLSIKEYATESDPSTQTFEAVMVMERPEGINLLSGLSVTVTAEFALDDANDQRQWIPAAAVFADRSGSNKQFVWYINPETMRAEARQVEIGDLQKDQIEILAGLEPGDQIVIAGVHNLFPNDRVRLIQTLGE